VLEEAGYSADEVQAWLEGMTDEQAVAAVQGLLGEAQHVLAGGEPAEGWADDDGYDQEPSSADRWAQAAAGDGYDQEPSSADRWAQAAAGYGYDGGYADDGGGELSGYDDGGEPAYAGSDGGYGGEG
jgi:hypothetical protein